MLRKLLALLLVVGFIGQASGLVWDVEKLFTGRQMIPYGAPWLPDDGLMYFGDGKDGSLGYDETTDDQVEATGTWNFAGTVEFDGSAKRGVTSTDVSTTISDSGNDYYLVGNDSAHQTMTLPTAAANTGRILTFTIATAPGSYNMIVDGEGLETINGAANLTNSANVGESISIICDGTSWYTVNKDGTWT